MTAKDDHFRTFDSTKVTTMGDDLFRISSKIPFFLFSIMMEGVSVLFFTAVFILWIIDPDSWLLDELCVFASFSVFFFGLILLISLLKFFKPFMNITDKIRPIRLKVKLEMFPIEKGEILQGILSRLNDCFYLGITDPKKYIGGENGKFDIRYESSQSSLIYVFTSMMLLIFLIAIFVEALVFSHFDSLINFALLALLELIVLSIFLTVILRFFYRKEVILIRYYMRKVSLKDIKEFQRDCEGELKGFRVPLVMMALSTKGFSDEARNLTSKTRVKGEYTVTLVKFEKNKFRVIWTG